MIMSFSGYLPKNQFDELLDTLKVLGAECIGPVINDHAIRYLPVTSCNEFPVGVQDLQSPASYQLHTEEHSRWFAWANGPQAIKPYLFAPEETLWQCSRDAEGKLAFRSHQAEPTLKAIIGVRACDLAAMALQDQHFIEHCEDDHYKARRQQLILIAVNCTHPAATCFCHATGDGPEAKQGYDILLDELDDGFIVRTATSIGERIIQKMALEPASKDMITQLERANDLARQKFQRDLPAVDIQSMLIDQQMSEHWQQIAERCLACGNCTSVCPSCFCHSHYEEPRSDPQESIHGRRWESCFNKDHSYIHGHTVHADTHDRYRQWMTHKFSTWIEQYGRSGCVGCGRCITWCPVGIDVTEELRAFANET